MYGEKQQHPKRRNPDGKPQAAAPGINTTSASAMPPPYRGSTPHRYALRRHHHERHTATIPVV